MDQSPPEGPKNPKGDQRRFILYENGSAPGLDIHTIEFYKANWDLIGQKFKDAIAYFFTSNFIYYFINSLAIPRIFKVDAPIRMKYFRPNSCCSVSYKVI